MIGVAVCGLGVGEQHARAFSDDPRAKVLWLHDLDSARAEKLSRELPGSRSAPSFEAMLADPAVQVVSIASFDDAHFVQARAALRAGKHVFVEKPLCTSEAELAELKTLWSGARGRQCIGSNLVLRTAAAYQWLKSAVSAGEFGTLYAIDGDYLYGRLHKITAGWRAGVHDYSVILGGAIHLIDLMLWLTGERPARVTASGNRISSADSEFRYDDYRAATLESPSGLVARMSANFGCVHRHQHVLRLFGTRATFIYDDAGARVHDSRDPAARPRVLDLAALPAGKGELIPGFLDAVSGKADYGAETQSFFDGISVCLAIDRAAASRNSETIRYV